MALPACTQFNVQYPSSRIKASPQKIHWNRCFAESVKGRQSYFGFYTINLYGLYKMFNCFIGLKTQKVLHRYGIFRIDLLLDVGLSQVKPQSSWLPHTVATNQRAPQICRYDFSPEHVYSSGYRFCAKYDQPLPIPASF